MNKQSRTVKAATAIRVAAAQFHVGNNVEDNLQTCLRMIKKAAECSPDLIVLPEFCNHLSWYTDQNHCNEVSLTLDSPWLQAISEAAQSVNAYIAINCTIRHPEEQDVCTATSLLYSPKGDLVASSDKQVYIGHENNFFRPAVCESPIVETPLGPIGLYACMDGVINETPRSLSLRGAHILCNSLNSFASDEGSLHIPVRAAENRVFVVAANKIGPLIPEELMQPVSEQTGIPEKFLCGAGESQIVAPDGTVLAKAGRDEAIVFADIDPLEAANKVNADGTDIFASRRPELYQAISQDPTTQAAPPFKGQEQVRASVVQLSTTGEQAIKEACEQVTKAAADGAELIALPELLMLEDSRSFNLDSALERSQQLVDELCKISAKAVIVTSIVIEENNLPYHAVVAIHDNKVVGMQKQLHASQRLEWSNLGNEIITLDLPIGRVGLVSGADIHYPELFRILAIKGAEVVVVPFSINARWEVATGLVERAAENRLNLLAATQPTPEGTSLIASLQKDFTVMTEWKDRPFDGLLSQPILTWASDKPGIVSAIITPACASNKIVSLGTDLVASRPWRIAGALTEH